MSIQLIKRINVRVLIAEVEELIVSPSIQGRINLVEFDFFFIIFRKVKRFDNFSVFIQYKELVIAQLTIFFIRSVKTIDREIAVTEQGWRELVV